MVFKQLTFYLKSFRFIYNSVHEKQVLMNETKEFKNTFFKINSVKWLCDIWTAHEPKLKSGIPFDEVKRVVYVKLAASPLDLAPKVNFLKAPIF